MREEGISLKKGYRGLSGKIFAILLIEAVFMGVAAAFFANSLVPKMMERYREDQAQIRSLLEMQDPHHLQEHQTVVPLRSRSEGEDAVRNW